jgi:pimeloyl-ACP methyl ester carboxylesterase
VAGMTPLPLTTGCGHGRRGGEVVVLTHGFMASRWMLVPLAGRLRRYGWGTRSWGYESWWTSVTDHAEAFSAVLNAIDEDPATQRLHLVTHSMGCIIGRAAIERRRPAKLGRFVMLAPPNRGSFVATATAGLFGRMFKPIAELQTGEGSLVNSLPQPQGIDVGVIAAGRDALVSLDATRLDVPHEHITLPCLHSSLLFRRDAARLVAVFLETGSFSSVAHDVS